MWKKWLAVGAVFAALSVILGAFAAHGLKSYVDKGEMDLQQLQNFETAARYQMYHALAIILCGILKRIVGENRWLRYADGLFTTGIVFFSGSLYLLSTRDIIHLSPWEWLGPITPIGGFCFILGWLFLALAVLQKEPKQHHPHQPTH